MAQSEPWGQSRSCVGNCAVQLLMNNWELDLSSERAKFVECTKLFKMVKTQADLNSPCWINGLQSGK